MELVTDVVNNQLYLYFPVALVLIGAVLVFTFGFKSAEQPHFNKLAPVTEDKKATLKKRKNKDKKVAINGNAVPVAEVKATKEKQSPKKESPTTPKQLKTKEPEKKKLVDAQRPNKPTTLEDLNNKKNLKTKHTEKPVDYDDGSWETVPTKNEKKPKKPDSPVKKPKKSKKVENENLKADVNQISEENKENINKIVGDVIKKDIVEEDLPIVQEKKEKKVKPEKQKTVPVEVAEVEVSNPVSEKPMIEELKPQDNLEKSSVKSEATPQGGVAFDELGDICADAKVVKKSKKKSRRDN